jgi:GTP-binding protein
VALGANNDQLNFATVYAIAKQGIAKLKLSDESDNLTPPFLLIVIDEFGLLYIPLFYL